nr:phage head closure protein [Clostridia bacterium]
MPLEDFFEDFRFMDYKSVEDGLGGFEHEHVPGATFRAAIRAMNSDEAVIAGKVGTKTIFRITTRLNVELEQNDVVLRVKDGRRYRVTGNAIDTTTPESAQEQQRWVTAEVIA